MAGSGRPRARDAGAGCMRLDLLPQLLTLSMRRYPAICVSHVWGVSLRGKAFRWVVEYFELGAVKADDSLPVLVEMSAYAVKPA